MAKETVKKYILSASIKETAKNNNLQIVNDYGKTFILDSNMLLKFSLLEWEKRAILKAVKEQDGSDIAHYIYKRDSFSYCVGRVFLATHTVKNEEDKDCFKIIQVLGIEHIRGQRKSIDDKYLYKQKNKMSSYVPPKNAYIVKKEEKEL